MTGPYNGPADRWTRMVEELAFDFDGETYDRERDQVRLTRQWRDIWLYMKDGRWRTLQQISCATGHGEASISARLRDFRKPRFGGHEVERRHLINGVWQYRLIPSPQIEVLTNTEEEEL